MASHRCRLHGDATVLASRTKDPISYHAVGQNNASPKLFCGNVYRPPTCHIILETRLLQNDLIWCLNSFRSYYNLFRFLRIQVEQHTWLSLQSMRRCSNATRSVFLERVINVRNSLPCDITNSFSVTAFKRSLRAIDLSGFCIGAF